MTSEDDDYLVPGRGCGNCTACCRSLAITADGMEKLPGVACVHRRKDKGCGIYAARPGVCRDYHCLWRRLDHLDARWRPDRSGILISFTRVPPGFPGRYAVELLLVGPPKALESEQFAGVVGGFIESGTATHLSVRPGPGLLSRTILLNDLLGPALAARDLAAMRALIRNCYKEMLAAPRLPITAADIARSRSPEGWSPPV